MDRIGYNRGKGFKIERNRRKEEKRRGKRGEWTGTTGGKREASWQKLYSFL